MLFASTGIEREIVDRATPVRVASRLVIPVAGIADLIAMKVLSRSARRARDSDDLVALIEAATDDDIAAARAALRLITERGAARDKDLDAELDRVLALARGDHEP